MTVAANSLVTGTLDSNKVHYTLAQSAAPVILPSSGSSNASGVITLTTALPYTPVGTVGIYLPAGVVTAGSQGSGAGVYQAVFSSTTVCQISGTGITSGNAAYTQTIATDLALATVTVPGGLLGPNGALRITTQYAHLNSAGSKAFKHVLGAAISMVAAATTNAFSTIQSVIRNRGAQNLNTCFQSWIQGGTNLAVAGTGAPGTGGQTTVDTSVNQALQLIGNLAVATDYLILDGYTVEVLPSP